VTTAIHRRVAACRGGADPTLIARMSTGWAVMGDPQVMRGYCLLLPDPVVPHLNAMLPSAQAAFLADMALLGRVLQEATGALRINYAMFGNLEPALHAHLFPRLASEPETLRAAHPWAWDWSKARPFDPSADGELQRELRSRLGKLATPPPAP
jgi:diadenosine tetraphosphate (Ap4A) HIT family hydrolase